MVHVRIKTIQRLKNEPIYHNLSVHNREEFSRSRVTRYKFNDDYMLWDVEEVIPECKSGLIREDEWYGNTVR